MKKTTRVLTLLAGACLVGASEVRAQSDEPKVLVFVNVGAQSHTHSLSTGGTFTAYDETGSFTSGQGTNGGFLFDVGAGYRVTNNIALALTVSRVGDTATASVNAEVPHPIFFDQLRPASAEAEGLDRSEIGVHVQFMYFLNLGFLPEGSDLAVTIGPSFFSVGQDLVTAVTVVPTPPAANPVIEPVVENESASAVGLNVGFDFTYPVTSQMGVGVFMRYAGASLDLPSADDNKAGGFQFGVGARLGF